MGAIIKQIRIIPNCVGLKKGKGGVAAVCAAFLLVACSVAPVRQEPPVAQVPAPVVVKRPPKLGLALGGGAARGFAHVGVIQVLEEAGLRPDFVTGTSAGSLVAALYASGRSGVQLQQVIANPLDGNSLSG